MEKFIYLVLLFTNVTSQHLKYFCYEHDITQVHLKPNEIIFFENENFPYGYIPDASYCKMNFILDTVSKNVTFIAFITNPILFPVDSTNPEFGLKYVIIYDKKNITWKSDSSHYYFHYFQAFAIFYERKTDECLLNNTEPFQFDDETQILYIRSSIYPITERKNNCNWEFIAPKGYGFKIVIVELNIFPDIFLIAQNSTDFFIFNQRSAKLNKAYYNEDNYLVINLPPLKSAYNEPRYEFGAYITIIKTDFEIVDANCQLSYNYQDVVDWGTQDGYPNNAYCSYEIEISQNTMIIAETDGYMEITDVITFSDEEHNKTVFFTPLLHDSMRSFLPYQNGSTKKVLWEFKSDGSVVDHDFRITFFKIYCFCQIPVWNLPCSFTEWWITNSSAQHDFDKFGAYCGNMKCNFTIQLDPSCPKTYLSITVGTGIIDKTISDKVRIISDNNTFYSFDTQDTNFHFAAHTINSNSTIIIEVITGESSEIPRTMFINLEPVYEPRYVGKRYLTKEKPYYVTDGSTYLDFDLFSVEIEDIEEYQNAFIEIYSSELAVSFSFYTDEKMSKVLLTEEKCFKGIDYHCKTNVKKLSVLVTGNFSVFLFFQIATNKPVGGCVFHPNVFVLSKNTSSFYAAINSSFLLSHFSSMTWDSSTPCRIYFLTQDTANDLNDYVLFYFTNIWTSSKNGVKVYTGFDEETFLFEYNSFEKWLSFTLYSHFYVFEIPSNSSLYINADQFPSNYTKIESAESQTLLHTPYYSPWRPTQLAQFPLPPTNIANYIIDADTFVTFNVTYYNISSFMKFEFFVNNKLQKMNKVGNLVTITNATVNVNYIPPLPYPGVPNYPGAIIHLKVIPKSMMTTTPLMITSSASSTEVTSTTEKIVSRNENYTFAFIICFILFAILIFMYLRLRK